MHRQSIEQITIRNFKSLQNVTIRPGALNLIIGPNASGKSNFAEAIEFISKVFCFGLKQAMSERGGFDNICFRQIRRTKTPIEFSISGYHTATQDFLTQENLFKDTIIKFNYYIAISVDSEKRTADYKIDSEYIKFIPQIVSNDSKPLGSLTLRRSNSELGFIDEIKLPNDLNNALYNQFAESYKNAITSKSIKLEDIESMTRSVYIPPPFDWPQFLRDIRVFCLNPLVTKSDSSPEPYPDMGKFGRNIPTVLKFIQENDLELYQSITAHLRMVFPGFEEINIRTKPEGAFYLQLTEKGYGRPWIATQLSDGTMLSIGLFIAVLNKMTPFIVIEEPENSLHPWALRDFYNACREALSYKQIILTSHSPVLQDMFDPSDVWLASKPKTRTEIKPLSEIDPDLIEGWQKGQLLLFDYLDSGAIREAVPGGENL